MCDVGVITTLALSAASVAANQQAQQAARNAMNKVNAAEFTRQKQLQQEQGGLVSDLITRHSRDNQDAQSGEAQAARQAAYTAAVNNSPQSSPAPIQPAGTAAPQVVRDEFSRTNARARNFVANQGRARSIMDAMADLQAANALGIARAGREVNRIGNFARGSLGASEFELKKAAHAGDTLKTVGDILQGLSAASGAATAAGKFPGWGSDPFVIKNPALIDAGSPASKMWSTATMIG
jgi:hypothetical protein